MDVLKKFTNNAQKYCLSQIPRAMYGFMPNTTMNEKVHDMIKQILPKLKVFGANLIQAFYILIKEIIKSKIELPKTLM